MAIKCQNQHDGSWMVYDTKSGVTAYIFRITEMFIGDRHPCGYRIDMGGRTVNHTDTFQSAKSKATELVKEEVKCHFG